MNNKLEVALSYAKKGWHVFPCAPNTKIPLIAGGSGVNSATAEIDKVREWWTAYPDANIGIACGPESGISVLDVDVKSAKLVNGFDSIKEAGLTIVDTLKQKTPSGGMHFIYSVKEEDNVGNAQNLKKMAGVDVRGKGGYIVAYPSTINGNAYEWVNDGAKIVPFPECFIPPAKGKSVFESLPPVCTVTSTPAVDRARAYLSEIPGAVEGVDGHAKLFWVAQVLVNGFRLSDSEAEAMMWEEYNPKCVPPWERNRSTEKEFQHKIKEAHAKPNPEAVSIYDAMPDNVVEEEFDFDACINDVRALLPPEFQSKVSSPEKLTKQRVLMDDMLVPEGLVGDIAKWMNETAGCYQPVFSLGASITLCGAIMGRKVCDESNGRTNIFCMGVGHSSCGKDHPGDCINRILTAAGAQNILMGRMTSDTAIEKALMTSSVKIAVIDEVGHFFSNVNKAGDGATYLKTIKPTLMEMFSSAHKTYIGKEKASGNPPVIDQPCMCIWGVTAPQKLYSGMTIEELQDGWIARNLIFISPTRPRYVMKPSAEVPPSLVESVRSWIFRTDGDILISATPGALTKPIVVPMNEEARAIFDKFADKAHRKMMAANERGEKTEYLWGKAFQNARRIALIVACGREFESPVIARYDADYACRLVEYLIHDAERAISENVSENKWEEEKNRIRHIIESSGIEGISRTDLTRRTQWIKGTKERNAYIDDLSESGAIVIEVIKPKTSFGKVKVVYRSKEASRQAKQMEEVEHVEAD